MFLNELNKSEASAFVNVVNEFVRVDNVLAKEEKALVDDYLEELNLTKENIGALSHNEAIEVLTNASERIKSIVYFELVGLALVDGKYEDEEIDFLDEIAEKLGISRAKKIAFANYFFNFTEVYKFSVVDAESKIKLLKEEAENLL
ncbi:MAG: hypothetical protein PUE01_14440 [Clostridiaceae bacterium]|nr:hypothetical protein [Clostridiaceae bacterium]